MLDRITPLILTLNEEANISRCLAQLTWAKRIVVVDSFSTDRTLELVRQAPQAEVLQREFDHHAPQCSFGLTHIGSEWTLSLDADYILTDALVEEMARLTPFEDTTAFVAGFRYCVLGRPLRGTLYPARPILFRTREGQYVADGHAHRLTTPAGKAAVPLSNFVHHDDRKPLTEWLRNQIRYASLEATKLRGTPRSELSTADRIRVTTLLGPLLVLPYCLVAQRGLLDGWPGLYYALQRTLAELILSLMLLDQRLRKPNTAPEASNPR
jgi:glycosyltransferase involved in cell wall biosynthesis